MKENVNQLSDIYSQINYISHFHISQLDVQ